MLEVREKNQDVLKMVESGHLWGNDEALSAEFHTCSPTGRWPMGRGNLRVCDQEATPAGGYFMFQIKKMVRDYWHI